MTLTGLQYFVELARARSFSQVAEKYYVSQSAVSYQIKALEKEVGTPLFERSTRSVKLTPEGYSFYIELAPIMDKLDAAVMHVRNRARQHSFTIGYSRICFGSRFKKLIDILSREYPDINIVLEQVEPEYDLFQRIRIGDIDAAVFFNPYTDMPEYVESRSFGTFPQKLIVSEHHTLSNCSAVKRSEIHEDEVVASEGMRRIETLGRVETNYDTFDNTHFTLKNMDSVLAMVQSNRAVAILPVIDDVSITGLKYITVEEEGPAAGGPVLTLIWNRAADSPVLRGMIGHASNLFSA